MIKINLLSEGKKPVVARPAVGAGGLGANAGNLALLGLLVLGLLVGGVRYWMLNNQIKDQMNQIAEAEREVSLLAPIIKEVEEFKAKKAELERKIQVITDLRANQRGPVQIMDEVSRALPELLWLTKMSAKANQITIQGEAFNTNAIAAFIDNLDAVGQFQEPILRSTAQTAVSGDTVYRFSIVFNYRPPAVETAAAE